MTDAPPSSDEDIRAARRFLEGHPHATDIGEPRWMAGPARWVMPMRLRVEVAPSAPIPATSNWFAAVEPTYPWGEIDLLPARAGGIQGTFPHQLRNAPMASSLPWTGGKICVARPSAALDRLSADDDPVGHPERLLWHVNRAVEWLGDAAAGTLNRAGEPFELPHFVGTATVVAFCEGPETFSTWRGVDSTYGLAEMVGVGPRGVRVVREFLNAAGTTAVRPEWGRLVKDAAVLAPAAWVRLDRVPVRSPYEAPGTWGELFEIMNGCGVRPEAVLRSALRPLRDEREHVLLVGFPIPQTVGGVPDLMHWQPAQLPRLAGVRTKGFGTREEAHWLRDLQGRLKASAPISWLEGQNWHSDALQARGRTDPALRRAKVLVVGLGALGSAVAELLVREGVEDVQVLDPDVLEAGNLVRHTLTFDDVGGLKARQLAARLNKASPLARVVAVLDRVPGASTALPSECADRTIVVDCTGSDWVLRSLSTRIGPSESVLVSLSMGIAATRLFAFVALGGFEFTRFRDLMQPWLRRDRDEQSNLRFPRAGAGCWHPVFPARCGEVWLHAAAATKIIAHAAASPPQTAELHVLEQHTDSNGLVTLKVGALDG